MTPEGSKWFPYIALEHVARTRFAVRPDMRDLQVFFLAVFVLTSDPASAEKCKVDAPLRYSVESGRVIYHYFGRRTALNNADAASFSVIPLPFGADPLPCGGVQDEFYAKDNHAVYYQHQRILNADAPTFEPMAWPDYAKDKYSVFYRGKLVEDADPSSFRLLKWPKEPKEAGKANMVYLELPPGTDWSVYTVDAHHVWNQEYLVPDLDAATFTLLPGRLIRDKNGTYKDGIRISQPRPP